MPCSRARAIRLTSRRRSPSCAAPPTASSSGSTTATATCASGSTRRPAPSRQDIAMPKVLLVLAALPLLLIGALASADYAIVSVVENKPDGHHLVIPVPLALARLG